MRRSTTPDLLPLLARGKHRSPRQGACFMEMASVLAGERWTDHPRCTDPLLAHLARQVNDATSDAGRGRLAPLVPQVVGLTGDEDRWGLEIAAVTAVAALPHAHGTEQQALAAALLTVDRLLGPAEGRDALRPSTSAALARVPEAAAWARRFTVGLARPRAGAYPGAAVVDLAVQAVLDLPRDPREHVLRRMLVDAVTRCRDLRAAAAAAGGPAPTDAPTPAEHHPLVAV